MGDFHNLLILMVVVWVMGKIFRVLTLPVIFGELLGGILVGPLAFNIIDPSSEGIKILAELGIFFLMLHAGLESDPQELFKGSKKSVLISLGGIIVPFTGGFIVSQILGFPLFESLFIAVAVSATAIAISVRILKDYKLKNTELGHTVLASAVLTDIILLIIFSVILGVYETGTIELAAILFLIVKVLLFFGIVIIGGYKMRKYAHKFFQNKGFTLTLIIALGLGLIAEWIGLPIIIGAFLAGLFIREELMNSKNFQKIEDRIYGLSYSFLGPIFFTTLGFHLNFNAIKEAPFVFAAILGVAFLGKFIGTAGAAALQGFSRRKAVLIGLIMNSRGAVDLVILSIGLSLGLITEDIFSMLLLITFASTLLAILAIRPIKKHV